MRAFQSHLGLISTTSRGSEVSPTLSLSIPPWSDFNLTSTRWRERQLWALSIPPWSDFNKETQSSIRRNRDLSIPPWSDFNPLNCRKLEWSIHLSIPPWSDFNLNRPEPLPSSPQAFNPTLVWFQQFHCANPSRVRKELSIPPWSDFNVELRNEFLDFERAFNPTLVWFQLTEDFS